jgi:6-phosphogluconolactonase
MFRFSVYSGGAVQDFLYASNFADNTISSYTIDPSSGALTAVPGSPFAAAPYATNPGPMVLDRFGKFLYVSNSANIGCKSCWSLSGFATDAPPGSLAALTGSPFFNSAPTAFVADPTGNTIYDSGGSMNYGDIVTYLIDANSGSLTEVADSPGFLLFASMAENPAGTFLYGASEVDGSSNGVWAGSISPTTGVVTVVPGSPFGGISTSAVAVDPSGSFVFAVNDSAGQVPDSTLFSQLIPRLGP